MIRHAIERELLLAAAQPEVGDHSALEEFLCFGSSRCAADGCGYAWTCNELYDERLSDFSRAKAGAHTASLIADKNTAREAGLCAWFR